MKKILIIDFETSSVNPNDCEVLEFGYIQTTEDCKILKCSSFLIEPENKILEYPDCNDINEELLKYSDKRQICIDKIKKIVEESDYIVAYNGNNFDFKILNRFVDLNNKTLIDALIDLPHKKPFNNYLKLSYLALEYGIYLQDGHRAINDCLALQMILKKFDFKEILEMQKIEAITLMANISYPEIQKLSENEKPKTKGFRWNVETKEWVKILRGLEAKNFDYRKMQQDCKFKIEIL